MFDDNSLDGHTAFGTPMEEDLSTNPAVEPSPVCSKLDQMSALLVIVIIPKFGS